MSNLAKMYWLTRLDNLHTIFIVFSVISLVTALCLYAIHYFEEIKIKRKGISIVTFFIFMLLCNFVPTKNEMILIYGGAKTMDFVQSDTSINKLPSQTTKIISDYLDKEIKSLKEEK